MKKTVDPSPSPDRLPRIIARFTATVCLVIASLTLVGWLLNIELLKSVQHHWSSIKVNTSIAFIFSSIALLLCGKKKKVACFAARLAAMVVLSIGSITAAAYLLNWNNAIDELLFKDNTIIGTGVPGRMSPFAAINFILLGIVLFIHHQPNKHIVRIVNTLAVLVFAVGLLQFNVYIFGISKLYDTWSFTHLSFSASVLYMFLSIGIIASLPGGGLLSAFLDNTKTAKISFQQLITISFLLILVSWLRVQGQNLGYYPTEIGVSLVVVMSFLIVAAVLWQGASVVGKAEKKQAALTAEVAKAKDELILLNQDLQQEIKVRKAKEHEILELNRNLEKRVQERTAQLQQINKELEAFSYSVSHDLRAPLRAVNGYAMMLLEDYGTVLDDEGKRLLHTIVNNGKMMGRLIDDLLKFSRFGRLELVSDCVDMHKLVTECLSDLQQLKQNLTYTVDVSSLPACRGDEAMLKQVWYNLLDNAVKYSSKNSAARIQVGSSVDGTQQIFWVKDNGAGFDMQYADKLFGVFQRLHRNDEFEGSGIGLALVQRIINKHRGNIWAEAEPGKGATFYFSLPKTTNDE